MMDGQRETVSLRQLVGVLRRRRWVLLQTVVIATAAAVFLSVQSDTVYRATAKLYIGAPPAPPLVGLGESTQKLETGTAAQLVRTPAIAGRVRRALKSGTSEDALLARVEVVPDERAAFVTVTASGQSGNEAARLANAFGREFEASRAEGARDRVLSAARVLERQLASVSRRSPEREALTSQLAQLRTLATLPSADASVVDAAVAPGRPLPKHPVRGGAIGFGLGLLLGLILIFALEAFDPRVRSGAQLQRLLRVPQLASIPAAAFKRGSRRRRRRLPRVVTVSGKHPEPFEQLRTSLLVFNADRALKSMLVTSPYDEREHKTTVAANLAVSLAKSGLDTCLVDGDLRRPGLAAELGLDGAEPGLTDLLAGAPLESVVQRLPVPGGATFPHVANGNGSAPAAPSEMTVICAGCEHPRPGELLASERMAQVLRELEARHDVVVIECAPVLAAGDAMPLAARTSGTVLVIRQLHTASAAAARAAQVIERAGGSVLGVVATDVPARDLRGEGYGPWPVAESPGYLAA